MKTLIGKNIIWLMSEYGVRVVVNLIVGALIGRALGVSLYGVFQYALSITLVFMTLSYVCGVEVIVPRLIDAKNSVHDTAAILGSAMLVRSLAAAISYLSLIVFAINYESKSDFYAIAILGMTILLAEPFQVVTAWFQSRTNIGPKSIVSILSLLLKLGIVAALYVLDSKKMHYYAFAWLVEFLAAGVGLWFLFGRYIGVSPAVSWKEVKSLLSISWLFFAALAISGLLAKLDIFMLKSLASDEQLGLYGAAAQFNSGVIAMAPIFIMSLAPKLIYEVNDLSSVKKNIYRIVMLVGAVGVVALFMVVALSSVAINVLYGADFYVAGGIWSLLATGALFVYVDAALGTYFIKYKCGELLVLKALLLLGLGYVAYSLSIPKYGALGAAYGYIFVSVCSVVLSLVFIKYSISKRGTL